jgi:hypothetical protein
LRIERRKKRERGQDDLIRLSVLFGIPPSEIDERLTGIEAAQILDYLGRFPEAADVIDEQLARLIQVVCSLAGGNLEVKDLKLRGHEGMSQEEDAVRWLRYINERKNGTSN